MTAQSTLPVIVMNNHKNPGLRISLLAAVLLGASAPAMALWGDRLELFVAENIGTDSNVFRISDAANPAAVLGASGKSDTFHTTSAGFNLDVPVSRQRFQAGATLNQTRYNRFTDLDFSGHDAHALWSWQAGDPLSGQLGYTDAKTLASFMNVFTTPASTVLTGPRTQINPLTSRRAFANAAYAAPNWRLQAGLADTRLRNGNLLRQVNDVDVTDADVTLSYVSTAGNSVGLGVRQQEGRYPNPQGTVFNNYTQRGAGIVVDWTPTGKSHLNGRVDRVKRDYDQVPARNFEGTTARALYDWKATGKFTLAAVAQRDISATEDITTSFVLLKGLSLKPSLEISDKLTLSGSADYSIRDYLGDPTLPAARTDKVHSVAAMLTYRPLRTLTVQFSAQRETRTSNQAFGDYTANLFAINGRLAF